MGTYFSGRKIVRATDATFGVSWSSVSTSDVSFSVTAAPTGCLGRIFIPLYKSTTTIGSTFNLWPEIADGVGSFVNTTSSAYGSIQATLPAGVGTRNYIINSTTGVTSGPRVMGVDGMSSVYYNGTAVVWDGVYGVFLLPTDRMHYNAAATAGAQAGAATLTCAVWEIY